MKVPPGFVDKYKVLITGTKIPKHLATPGTDSVLVLELCRSKASIFVGEDDLTNFACGRHLGSFAWTSAIVICVFHFVQCISVIVTCAFLSIFLNGFIFR